MEGVGIENVRGMNWEGDKFERRIVVYELQFEGAFWRFEDGGIKGGNLIYIKGRHSGDDQLPDILQIKF